MARQREKEIVTNPAQMSSAAPLCSAAEEEQSPPAEFAPTAQMSNQREQDNETGEAPARREKKTARGLDPEVKAMHRITEIMRDLPPEHKAMVAEWFARKYGEPAPSILELAGQFAQLGRIAAQSEAVAQDVADKKGL